ncbi:hypothetical protein EMGBD2_08470 [Nitrospirota bacterium]|nr:hypothetical protein EMGBD2_08470 [Nitrospirota bacterium]
MRRFFIACYLALCGLAGLPAQAAELPITKNLPIPDFQNRSQDARPYDFDAPPQGLFLSMTMAEGFDEELDFRRTHEIVPVKPTDRFRPDTPTVLSCFIFTSIIRGSRCSAGSSLKRYQASTRP